MKTKVHFRTFRDGRVIALFPEFPADPHGDTCQSYMIVGQHGGAYPGPIDGTRPATPEEADEMTRALRRVGYENLHPVSRITSRMHETRRNTTR